MKAVWPLARLPYKIVCRTLRRPQGSQEGPAVRRTGVGMISLHRDVTPIFFETAMPMTDPTDSLKSFQEHFSLGVIDVQPGALDRDLFVYQDQPNGTLRLTYVRLNGQTVTALVLFVLTDPIDGVPCFQLGYAVPEVYRSQGVAKAAVSAAIAELKHGLGRNGAKPFFIEAIVGADNLASQRVASETLSVETEEITDVVSGLPGLR